MFEIPSGVHVDANMHPRLNARQHVFALFFGLASIWAFNPHVHRRFSQALSAGDLGSLALGCSADWTNRGSHGALRGASPQ